MRHMNGYRKLNRTSAHRKAMFKNMVTSLLRHGQIKTTVQKAKELRRIVEKVITLSRRVTPEELTVGTPEEQKLALARRLHAVRLARQWVEDRDVLRILFSDYGPRFKTRPGGYTRIYKLGFRAGDNADMALIQILSATEATVPAAAPTGAESASAESAS